MLEKQDERILPAPQSFTIIIVSSQMKRKQNKNLWNHYKKLLNFLSWKIIKKFNGLSKIFKGSVVMWYLVYSYKQMSFM